MIGESTAGQLVPEPARPLAVAQNLSSPLPKPSVLEVVYDLATDVISIKSRETPLGTVLREISTKTHLTLSSSKEVFDERVSVEFNRLPLDHALKRLLEGFNSTFVYGLVGDPARNAPNEAPAPRLAKVMVLSKKAAHSLDAHAVHDQQTQARSTYETKSTVYAELAGRDPAEVLRVLIEGGPEVIKGIVNALREPWRDQEREKMVEVLLERLDNGDFVPSDAVLVALKELAPDAVRDALVKRLSGADPRMRALSAAALGRLGDEGAIEPLLSVLRDDETTRRVAANSLVLIGGRRTMDALLQAYVAGDNNIRYPVSVAIASFGDERSQKALAKLIAAGLAPRELTPEEAGMTNPNSR